MGKYGLNFLCVLYYIYNKVHKNTKEPSFLCALLCYYFQADHNVPSGAAAGPVMSSALHRRSLNDVEALGLFHHGRGVGKHLSRQCSEDARRRSTASLANLAILPGTAPGRKI